MTDVGVRTALHGIPVASQATGGRLMIRALGLALVDLGNRRLLAIMFEAVAISLAIFAAVGAALVWLLRGADPCALLGLGSCPLGTGAGAIGAIVITLLGIWFLFPAVAITVMTSFADRIAGIVEELHYPEAASDARRIGLWQGLLLGARSGGRLLLVNLVALPFYLLLLVTGIGPLVLFVIANGIAFGRDVSELAAARHGNSLSRRAWLKQTRGQQHLVGIVVSILFLVPFANLLAPVIGAAAGIHLFNQSFWRSDSDD